MKVVKGLREAIKPVRHMADYNFTPALSSRTRQVQALDQENGPGKREVYISKHHYLLEGFQLHREFPFDSVISSPLSYNIDRAALSATIHLPQLAPGANINIPWKRPLYRIVAALGFVCDSAPSASNHAIWAETPWWPVTEIANKATLTLKLPEHYGKLDEGESLVLSIGVETGRQEGGLTVPLKYGGCAKILALG
jgi:hypothetical protein